MKIIIPHKKIYHIVYQNYYAKTGVLFFKPEFEQNEINYIWWFWYYGDMYMYLDFIDFLVCYCYVACFESNLFVICVNVLCIDHSI